MNCEAGFPAVKEFTAISLPDFEIKTLSNGVTIDVLKGDYENLCRFHFIFNGGLYSHPNSSVPRLLLQLITEGCSKYSSDEVAELIDRCGATIAKNVHPYNSVLEVTVLKSEARTVLDVLAATFTEPLFDSEKTEVFKNRLSQSLARVNDIPRSFCISKFNEQFYPQGSLPGKIEQPSSPLDVTRDDLIEFFNSNYIEKGLHIIASGDIDEYVLSELNCKFGIAPFSKYCKPEIPELECRDTFSGSYCSVNRDESVQSSIITGLSLPGRDNPDYTKLKVLTALLGGGGYFGSRLMQTVREEHGYTYGISSYMITLGGISQLRIVTECDISYTKAVLSDINQEIDRLRTGLVSEEELTMLKSYLMSSSAKMIDKAFDYAEYRVFMICGDILPTLFEKQVATIMNITGEGLRELSVKYLKPECLGTVVVTNESVLNKI